MTETKEISALLTLIDDPDEEVFSTVSGRIMEYGRGIIPNLENLWENTTNDDAQEKIELLIHRLYFSELITDFTNWKSRPYHDLLLGALLVCKFQYPDIQTTPVLQQIEKIKKDTWLELNSFLTPLEQANVLGNVLYNHYSLKGSSDFAYDNPDEFFIHKVLQAKKGNTLTNGIIYLVLCELLDLNVRALNIPDQFVLAFYKSENPLFEETGTDAEDQISFFIDPSNGQAFTHRDIHHYFRRIEIEPQAEFFRPLPNSTIIHKLISQLSLCFSSPENVYKKKELEELAGILAAI